jgi:hypothetical protein
MFALIKLKKKNMKKKIIYSFAAIELAACSSNEKTARTKVEEYIQANANDPKSYEFIDMGKPDTTRISDTLETSAYLDSLIDLDLAQSSLERAKSNVAEYEEEIKGAYGYIYMDSYNEYVKEVGEYTEKIEKAKIKIAEKRKKILGLKQNPKSDEIVRITYTVNFRLKNGLGALMKTKATITYSPKGEKWDDPEISK